MLLGVWKAVTVDSCFHLSFTSLRIQSNSTANTVGGTKYIYFKQGPLLLGYFKAVWHVLSQSIFIL